MAKYSAIADVGNVIIKILKENMTPEPVQKPELIGLCSPFEKGDFMLTVYLYDIRENGESRRVTMMPAEKDKQKYPPMSLSLYYMVTAFSNAEISTRAIDEQRILGKAMQVLYDHAELKLSFTEEDSSVRISLDSLPKEEKLKYWSQSSSPYKLSAFYVVDPVIIDSERSRDIKRVVDVEYILKG